MAIQTQKIRELNTVSEVPSGSKLLLTPDNGSYARATVPSIVGSAMETGDFNINSTTNKVELKERTFTGTTAQWNALTIAQKAQYTFVNLTDDSSSGISIDSVPTENSTNPVSSGGVYNALEDVNDAIDEKCDLDNIVDSNKTETTTTATAAHTAGDYFDLNGVFVKAKTNIAIDDTLVENTNYESTNIGRELSEIKFALTTLITRVNETAIEIVTESEV